MVCDTLKDEAGISNCRIEEKMSEPRSVYSVDQSREILGKIRDIHKSLSSGQQEKLSLMADLAKLKVHNHCLVLWKEIISATERDVQRRQNCLCRGCVASKCTPLVFTKSFLTSGTHGSPVVGDTVQ